MIVEDDDTLRESFRDALEDAGYVTVNAEHGREALAMLRAIDGRRPDVIVLDLMMPEVNGFDVVAALNEHPDTACIPILVVTAKEITGEDRAKLNGYVTAIMEKAEVGRDRFTTEVRRAMSGRTLVA